jgi:menaquinone-dependent protoporphyrinogen IX oxidase
MISNKKCTIEEFITKSKNVFGNLYDYSKVDYKGNKVKVEIICKDHGSFFIEPNRHLSKKSGCNKCGIIKRSKTQSNNNWLEKFIEVHGDRYDYSKVEYINNKTPIEIICKEHGSFLQAPYSHIRSNIGCVRCLNETLNKKFKNKKWLDKFIKIHGDRYDYSKVEYKNSKTKVEIICKEHGSFLQTPFNHYQNQGCPICNISKGERKIMTYFDKKSIYYESGCLFKDCKDKKTLRFDFFIPEYNLCIEYDGIQHFKSFNWFGGDKNFESQKRRDYIKDIYCLDNKISLIRISYLEYDRIYDILDSIFNI